MAPFLHKAAHRAKPELLNHIKKPEASISPIDVREVKFAW